MLIKNFIKKTLRRIGLNLGIDNNLAKYTNNILAESFLCEYLKNPKYQNPKNLNRYERQIFSQGGEDGIIEEIFKRIGTTNKYFVELGIGNGLENNTAYLLLNHWSGLWLDRSSKKINLILQKFQSLIEHNKLMVKQAFVTAENIETLLQELNAPKEFDLLSIDIDGNDCWVWQVINKFSPRVVVIEYNASLGPQLEWAMEYNSQNAWDHSLYFGASLKAIEKLGQSKGYKLVGCELTGNNAFFIKENLVGDKFVTPFNTQNHFEPEKNYLLHETPYPRSYKFFENLK